jgi:hypothetical protein
MFDVASARWLRMALIFFAERIAHITKKQGNGSLCWRPPMTNLILKALLTAVTVASGLVLVAVVVAKVVERNGKYD